MRYLDVAVVTIVLLSTAFADARAQSDPSASALPSSPGDRIAPSAYALPSSPGDRIAVRESRASSDASPATPAEASSDSVFRHRSVVGRVVHGAGKLLAWELVVPAPVEDVWEAWATADGIATWSAPAGAVDLRPGGTWEAHFEPDRPKGQRGSDANEILDLEPGRLLVIRAGAPMRFPTVREEKTTFYLTLTPVGRHHTLVQATQTGWKDGSEWEEAFEYLAGANAVWLDWLHQRFTSGPIDWTRGPAR